MVTSRFDYEAAAKVLKDKFRDWKCPYSGHTEWTLVPEFVEFGPFYGGSMVVRRNVYPTVMNVYPAVMIVCSGCGHLAFFSSVVLGLTPSVPATEPSVQVVRNG